MRSAHSFAHSWSLNQDSWLPYPILPGEKALKTCPAEAWAASRVGSQGGGVASRHLLQRSRPSCRRDSFPEGLREQTGLLDVETRTAGQAAAGQSKGEPRLGEQGDAQSLTLGQGRSSNLRSFGSCQWIRIPIWPILSSPLGPQAY